MENDNLEISHPVLVYTFLVLFITFSIAVLHAAKNGIRIRKYLKGILRI